MPGIDTPVKRKVRKILKSRVKRMRRGVLLSLALGGLFFSLNGAIAESLTETESDLEKLELTGPVSSVEARSGVFSGHKGEMVASGTWILDSRGNVLKEKQFTKEGDLDCYYIYSFDEQDRKTGKTCYNPEGSLRWKISQLHDQSGRVMREALSFVNGTEKYHITYQYNQEGRLAEKAQQHLDKNQSYRIVHSYDGRGRLSESKCYTHERLLAWKKSYSYENGAKKSVLEEGGPGNRYRDTRIYDERGNLVEWKREHVDSQYSFSALFSYDEADRSTELLQYRPDGSLASKKTYEYVLDDHGNWIRQTMTSVSYSSGREQSRQTRIIQKTIGYAGWVGSGEEADQVSESSRINYSTINSESSLKVVVQDGHVQPVGAVAFSPDGRFLATGGVDVILWNSEGKIIRKLSKSTRMHVADLAFAPDGQSVAAACGDFYHWSVDGSVIVSHPRETDQIYTAVAFSPDGGYLAIGLKGGQIRILQILEAWRTIINEFQAHEEAVTSLAFSPDGKQLASGGKDKTIKLWKGKPGLKYGQEVLFFEPHKTIRGHRYGITSVGFSPDGGTLVAGSYEYVKSGINWESKGSIRLWSTDGELLKVLPESESGVSSAAFTPDGTAIVGGSIHDPAIRIWNREGKLVDTASELWLSACSLAISPEGGRLACGTANKEVRLYTLDGRLIKNMRGKRNEIHCVAVSEDSGLIAAGSSDYSIKLWSSDGRLIRVIRQKGEIYRTGRLAFSPDARYLFSADYNGQNPRLLTIEGEVVCTFESSEAQVLDTAFSPDGRWLAVLRRPEKNSEKRMLKLWTVGGEPVRTLKAPDGAYRIVFDPAGENLLILSKGAVTHQAVDTDRFETFTFDQPEAPGAAVFSPDRRTVAMDAGSGIGLSKIQLRNTEGRLLREFSTGYPPLDLHFTSDGKHLATHRFYNSEVRLWDLEGNVKSVFDAKNSPVNGFRLSGDGRLLVAAYDDGTVRGWSVKTGEHAVFLSDKKEWIVYMPDGTWDASRHGGDLAAMVKGMQAWNVDQFAVRYNRPDLILERLGSRDDGRIHYYLSQYQRRLYKLGLEEGRLTQALYVPEAEILATEREGKHLRIRFRLQDRRYELLRYNIYVNDVPLYGAYGKELDGRSAELEERAELTYGENKIEISCLNVNGSESYRAVTYAHYEERVKGNLYFIGFGVSEYKDSSLNLGFAHKDVRDLASVFLKMEGRFDRVFIRTFTDEEVTGESIRKAKSLLEGAEPDDTFVLFIAGHGVHDTDPACTYYYLTHDADLKNLSETAADFELIEKMLQGIAPRNKLFLMDTCESGEIEQSLQSEYYGMTESRGISSRTPKRDLSGRGLGVAKAQQVRTYLYETDRYIHNDLMRRSGAIVFSSCRGNEFSYESEDFGTGNGAFTCEIINALTKNNADRNRDGWISTDELRSYVSAAVPKLTADRSQPQGYQHPTVDRDNIYQRFGFPVVKSE